MVGSSNLVMHMARNLIDLDDVNETRPYGRLSCTTTNMKNVILHIQIFFVCLVRNCFVRRTVLRLASSKAFVFHFIILPHGTLRCLSDNSRNNVNGILKRYRCNWIIRRAKITDLPAFLLQKRFFLLLFITFSKTIVQRPK